MKRIDYRWVALGLLWVAYFLLQGTRQIYGATLPQIRADFGIDDLRMGMVASVFFFAYAAVVPLGGFAADLFRRKGVIVLGSALFVSGVFLASFASSVGLLILTYGVLNGVGQSLVPTSSTSVIQQLHADSRATGSLAVTAAVLAVYGFVHGFYDANFIASFYEVIVPRYRTSAYGLYACGAFALGACAPVVLGALRQSFPMTTAFATLGGFYLAAAALTLVARTVFLKHDYEEERR